MINLIVSNILFKSITYFTGKCNNVLLVCVMEIPSKFARGRLAKGRPMRKKGWLTAILFYFNFYTLPFSYITHLQVYLNLQAAGHIQIS